MKAIWKKILNSTIVYLIDAVVSIFKIGRDYHDKKSNEK